MRDSALPPLKQGLIIRSGTKSQKTQNDWPNADCPTIPAFCLICGNQYNMSIAQPLSCVVWYQHACVYSWSSSHAVSSNIRVLCWSLRKHKDDWKNVDCPTVRYWQQVGTKSKKKKNNFKNQRSNVRTIVHKCPLFILTNFHESNVRTHVK